MSQISASDVKKLREMTAAPLMDCKKALTEAEGDIEKAQEILRMKGLKSAEKKAGRATSQGAIGIYQHHDGRKASVAVIGCESDFVAKTEQFQELAQNIAKHVLAMSCEYISRDDLPADEVKKEEELIRAESAEELAKKPEAAHAKILEGRMRKFFQQRCLMEQKYIFDESKTIEQLLKEAVASLGENMAVQRIERFEVGG